jgi:magnesium chelatase accessory protein
VSSVIWERDGRDWPNRRASRFVRAGGIQWHVQLMGSGPVIVLAHGTGASTHSWRDLAPRLARDFTVVAPDLPGHAFTETPRAAALSLPGMARSLATLMRVLDLEPDIAVGHSAGAAVLARMSLDGVLPARALVSINGALLPLHGMAGTLFSGIARALLTVPLVPRLFALYAANSAVVERLIRDTGSHIDAAGLRTYATLLRDPKHVAGALGMMANWDLRPLERDLPCLTTPLTLIAADGDRTIQPADSDRVAAIVPGARVVRLPSLGHLAHEEDPEAIRTVIQHVAQKADLFALSG